ncbi:amidase [Rhizobium rosettiformans]|uniref:amidase n=1 Tax=Rhizobium rosettiformans TaxID=1368430 RepID=UPI0028607782|nr:amidase [Rhizobium rosettiformans]MDR7029177.1 amidase [Rhizobium rosettiformans]MDR7062891.1 amidase [Rhizobium rosettiformans]
MSDLTSLSLSDLQQSLHTGSLSAEEVMTGYLDRIERFNPQVNALVSLRPRDVLLAEARAKDAERAQGGVLGALHGVPIAIKDLSEAKGILCTYGSPLFHDYVPDFDDIQVERIREAGAIIIGKTNTPEWGFGSHSYNPVFGVTRNPWDLSRSAGGSSGGAGAALAARLVPIADGSDMMGSLRNPAAFNNVVGFRPSFGRIPTLPGRDGYLNQLATLGPMGRSVTDVVTLLNMQSGFDPRDPSSFESGPVVLDRDIAARGGRIGWLGNFGGHLSFEPGVLDLSEKALTVFQKLGFAVEPLRIDFDMNRLWWAWTTLRSYFTAGSMRDFYEDPGRRGSLKPEILYEVRSGLRIQAADVYEASAVRTAWYQALAKAFETYDYLIAPAAQVFPFDAEIPWPREIAGKHMDTYHRWMEVVIGPSLAGLPVAALPAGFSPQGLPNGFQLIGKPRADQAVLSVAAAYEGATDWLARVPPLAADAAG